ncbi:MAG TPA: hypothetical protein VGB55_13485, partial [Tepidisphaeraceae bacterium]
MFRSLESRRLFAAQIGLSNGQVTVAGSDTLRDEINVTYVNVGSSFGIEIARLEAVQRDGSGEVVSSITREFDTARFTNLKIDTRGGNDQVIITDDFSDDRSRHATVYGGSGDDLISAGMESLKLIDGGSGNDRLSGAATIRGGTGDDILSGTGTHGHEAGGRWEKLYGDAGRDTIYGNVGNDVIDGGVSN